MYSDSLEDYADKIKGSMHDDNVNREPTTLFDYIFSRSQCVLTGGGTYDSTKPLRELWKIEPHKLFAENTLLVDDSLSKVQCNNVDGGRYVIVDTFDEDSVRSGGGALNVDETVRAIVTRFAQRV